MRLQVKIHGADALAERLRALDRRTQSIITRRALRRGIAVWRRTVRAKIAALDIAAEVKQRLRKGLRIQVTRGRGGMVWGRLRMRMEGVPIWYWIEKGTAERHRVLESEFDLVMVNRRSFLDSRSKTGKFRRATTYAAIVRRAKRTARTGRMKAQPFIGPALQAAGDEVIQTLEREVLVELEAAWRGSK